MRILVPFLASFIIHAGVLIYASSLPAAPKKASRPIEVSVLEKKKPPPPPPPPEPKLEEPKPKPKPIEAPKKVKPPPKAPEPEPPPSPEPPPQEPPKPQVFSVDMESTVKGGEGPAVRAAEGGGNMFADPKTQGEAGPKQTVRTPPASGAGTTPGAAGSGTIPPVFAIPEGDRRPPYPEEAKRAEVEGRVMLRVLVDADGKVIDVKLVKGIGFGCDEAAIKHARTKWKFKPGSRNGVATPMWIPVPVTFQLDE